MNIGNVSQKLSSSGRTLVHFIEAIKEGISGRNSLRRTPKVARTMGFHEAVKRISIG
jgi:hypothetical protein